MNLQCGVIRFANTSLEISVFYCVYSGLVGEKMKKEKPAVLLAVVRGD